MKKPILIITLVCCALITNAQDLDREIPSIDIPAPIDTTQNVPNEVPEFPGGPAKFHQFIQDHIHAKIEEKGRVMVEFVVEKDGTITEIKIVQSVSRAADNAVIQAIRRSPKWKPGTQNGKPVRVAYKTPVMFY